eukprot:scaffold9553_cov114-Isochrysis_galbana.AAC.6
MSFAGGHAAGAPPELTGAHDDILTLTRGDALLTTGSGQCRWPAGRSWPVALARLWQQCGAVWSVGWSVGPAPSGGQRQLCSAAWGWGWRSDTPWPGADDEDRDGGGEGESGECECSV